MLDVIDAARKVTGRPIETVHRPPAAEAHTLLASNDRVRSALGWQPAHSDLETILTDAWEHRA